MDVFAASIGAGAVCGSLALFMILRRPRVQVPGAVCPACDYSLGGLGSGSSCPECGLSWKDQQDQRTRINHGRARFRSGLLCAAGGMAVCLTVYHVLARRSGLSALPFSLLAVGAPFLVLGLVLRWLATRSHARAAVWIAVCSVGGATVAVVALYFNAFRPGRASDTSAVVVILTPFAVALGGALGLLLGALVTSIPSLKR